MRKNLIFFKAKYLLPIALLGVSVSLLFFKLYWLSLSIIVISVSCFFLIKCIARIKNTSIRKVLKIVFYIFFVLVISSALKSFVVGIYIIPSNSMENTLIPGDVVFVNKLIYGPKLPRSPFDISWIDILFSMNNKAREAMNEHWWPYKRLVGSDTIRQGDVLIYELSRGFFVVKRCVAIAGDTLVIRNGKPQINEGEVMFSTAIKNSYRIKPKKINKLRDQIDSMEIKEKMVYFDNKRYDEIELILSYKEYNAIKTLQNIKRIEQMIDTFNLSKEVSVFSSDDTNYTVDNMGPFIVPKKGMEISMNINTFNMYKKALLDHEKVRCTEVNGEYYINDKKAKHYTFRQDYYFVMGDNRKKSIDSRYVGFIPEEDIIGKVQGILFSNKESDFRWDRLLKSVY